MDNLFYRQLFKVIDSLYCPKGSEEAKFYESQNARAVEAIKREIKRYQTPDDNGTTPSGTAWEWEGDPLVKAICERAIDNLSSAQEFNENMSWVTESQTYKSKVTPRLCFKKRALKFVHRALRIDSENSVAEFLPYLLVAYTYNLPHNKIENFKEPDNDDKNSWNLLFNPDEENNRENYFTILQSYAKHFTLKLESINVRLFPDQGLKQDVDDLFGNSSTAKKQSNTLTDELEKKITAEYNQPLLFLELLRRFLAFAEECSNLQECNLTLSFYMLLNSMKIFAGGVSIPIEFSPSTGKTLQDKIMNDNYRLDILKLAELAKSENELIIQMFGYRDEFSQLMSGTPILDI